MNTPASSESSGNLGEDRRKHLEFVQNVIARMSSMSNIAKGWCLTIASATFGYALTRESASVAALGSVGVLLFGLLDARYLREEKKFRALYDDARVCAVTVYEMRAAPYADRNDPKFDESCAWRRVFRSWAIWGFYGPLVAVGLVAFLRAVWVD